MGYGKGDIASKVSVIDGYTKKIDSAATLGMNAGGVSNSLSYRVHEIEKHFHSIERWFGNDGDGTMSTASNLEEWTLTAGTGDAYGSEVQISNGSVAAEILQSDFGFAPVKYDLHRVMVTVSSANDKNYMIQIWSSSDAVFANATLATEFPYRTGSNLAEVAPVPIQMGRQAVATNLWMRCKCETNSATVQMTVGIHAYVG